MKLSLPKALLLPAVAIVATSLGVAQIKRLTLAEMVHDTDNAIEGTIVSSRVFRVDDPVDGPELYFTELTIAGRSTYSGDAMTSKITFMGGFINEEEGVYNSEAPSADDVKLGNRVLAFSKWYDNIAGGVSGNALVAAHGGLYRIAEGRRGAIVLGRGDGYAVSNNVRLSVLEARMADILGDVNNGGK